MIIGRATGPDFDKQFGSSRNHPKSIGIDQESIISHFGIIKTPNCHSNTIKKPGKTQKSPNFLPPRIAINCVLRRNKRSRAEPSQAERDQTQARAKPSQIGPSRADLSGAELCKAEPS